MQRIKTRLYIFVIVLVGVLFFVRIYNAVQKTDYLTQVFEENEDVQIFFYYPVKILSPKIETLYPLTISFSNRNTLSPVRTYEITFESPTLLFLDSKGGEISPRLEVTSDSGLIKKMIYIRPFLSGTYISSHQISVKVVVDGQELVSQPDPIDIKSESRWFSYLSLLATFLLEISIASVLVTWIVNALDTIWNSRKELMDQLQNEIQGLMPLPLLERMRKLIDLDKKIKYEHLEENLKENIDRIKCSFSEVEFLHVVGKHLRQGNLSNVTDLETLYDYFFNNHKDSISALAKIVNNLPLDQPLLSVISKIVKLWDEFDMEVKDLIVGALVRLPRQGTLRKMPAHKIEHRIFKDYDRRRLLHIEEIQSIFPQLVDPNTGKPLPVGYNATWLGLQNYKNNLQITNWLNQHCLVINPFGHNDFGNHPFYPEGFSLPDSWEDFLNPIPQFANCPTVEDEKALSFLLRDECLPVRKGKNLVQFVESKMQIFPIMISLKQTSSGQLPLCTLAHSAAQTWLDILPLCPDALLDLSQTDQQALVELLCWSLGSNSIVIDLIKRNGLKEDKAGQMLTRKIMEPENKFSKAHLPQDSILLSWLGIRPPELNMTFLILPVDEFHPSLYPWWFEQFSSSISSLFLNGIVTKILTSTSQLTLSLKNIELSWSDGPEGRLYRSLEGQFDAAMNPEEKLMGKSIRFHDLFGPGVTEEITQLLISSSKCSLSRTLALGNLLFQHHCEQKAQEKYLSIEELNDILMTE